MSRVGLAVFVVWDGMLLGGRGYLPGDRVVVVHWRGSMEALVTEAAENLLAQEENPPRSEVREKLLLDTG